MQIRPARPADAEAITELVQREKVAQGYVSIAVDAESEVLGLIVLIEEPDHLLVENVAVVPERQSQGIGRALLAFAENVAAEADLATLRLYTNAAMIENLAFYPRLGYSETNRRTDGGFERVFFSKHLKS